MKHKKPGRPKKAPGDRRSRWVLIRLTPGEHRRLKSYCQQHGKTMVSLMRQVALQLGEQGESIRKEQK